MILLKNPKVCPQCFCATVSRDNHRCTTCQCRLMWPDSNFAQLQREEWKHFYVFFKDRGWVHADHVGRDSQPNSPDVTLVKPAESYGRTPLPGGCSAAKMAVLALLLLLLPLVGWATPACITNLTVTTQNGWVFDVAGDPSDCYSIVDSYTNLSCIGLLAGSCDYGTALVFRNTNCLASAATVATVTATCNQGVICANGQGGAYHCQPGDSFTISMPAGVSMFAIRIYPGFSVCCSITYCEITDRMACIPPAPHGDP